MPHIRIRGTQDSTVGKISTRSEELAKALETTADNFTFEKVSTTFYDNGKNSEGYPFVEVLWFPRSQEVKQTTATLLTNMIKQYENHHPYITVIFYDLSENSYFENGTHF